ncbi:hypothetical protein EI94DRAFT_1696145 [Lactarius quietus]|nr:hypothetical protein EI94DRAFT_1696145 [Lactarius quietus]
MTVSRDPHPSCNNLPTSIWGSTASYQVTHELVDSACLVISEVTVVFCRYECAYGLFFLDVLLITCLPDTCAVSGFWQLEQGLSVTQRDFGPSFATLIKPLFPASFQLLLDEGPESGDGVAEGDEDEDDDDIIFVRRDWTPESSSRVAGDIGASEDHEGHNNLPILAEAVTNHVCEDVSLPQPSPSESTISPPSAPPLNQELVLNVSDTHCVPSEEGGESPASQLGNRCHRAETSPISHALTPHVSPHQTRSLSRSA